MSVGRCLDSELNILVVVDDDQDVALFGCTNNLIGAIWLQQQAADSFTEISHRQMQPLST
jgi:hypothetical protein